jgi:hypothetical protein
MAVHHIRIALCLFGLTAPGTAFGQTQAGDSSVRSPQDSSPALTDSAANSTSTGDSASSADTTRPASDTSQSASGEKPAGAPGQQGAGDTAGAGGAVDSIKPAAATTPLPTDSILSTACSSSAGPTSTAPDLLVVVFTPETGSADRAAAAKSVKGRLLGQVVSEPGAYYLWVPAAGQEYGLRAAADQLIRFPAVRQVGSRACPSPNSADTSGPKPSKPKS